MKKDNFIIKAKNGYVPHCLFHKVGDAMKFAHQIGLEFGQYEIIEIFNY